MSKSEDETTDVTPEPTENKNIRIAFLEKHLTTIIIACITIPFVILIVFGLIGKNSILKELSNLDLARGLITFIVAVGTIAIAIIIVLFALMSKTSDMKERFNRGKEVLSIFIGVLGTIVGFYYGTSNDNEDKLSLNIAKPIITIQKTKDGQNAKIVTFISNGTLPYSYLISIPKTNIAAIEGLSSQDGWINETIKLPNNLNNNLELKIEIIDAKGVKKQHSIPIKEYIQKNILDTINNTSQ